MPPPTDWTPATPALSIATPATLDMTLGGSDAALTTTGPQRTSGLSRFEQVIANNPPVLRSLIAQLPTQSIFDLYHTSYFLSQFFRDSPTSWRYMSWRLHQPSPTSTTNTTLQNANGTQRQSGSYALDQLLFNLIIPFSTRLTSLVLDNTSVSGATLFSAVMILRKDTLEHVSVRGCKNVSLKYHVNPWLAMHAMAIEQSPTTRPPCFQNLALKSLYTYRCRHHRRRPYLPASLNRKESDSEPTHELVLTCHKLGIWTDTAWCTTPGARCYRRRGYVNMRPQQDLREVWVVFDRLWRSRNWLGPPPTQASNSRHKSRKLDGRFWEEAEAVHGEAVGLGHHGKHVPMHQRDSHRVFVEDIYCDDCAEPIPERCEQCSVMMHCFGCRRTLCASCAFDRPYLRNANASDEDRQRFWWAPGSAVSPCCMLDADPVPTPGNPHNHQVNPVPNIKFRWCCSEPVFSGGGGITLTGSQTHDEDPLRAAPLLPGRGYEDAEFATSHAEDCPEIGAPLSRANASGPGGRWSSLAEMFKYGVQMNLGEENDTVPRMLCNECYTSDQWKIKCKSCSVALCLRHDVKEKQRVRICGYKELSIEKQELITKLKATKVFRTLWLMKKEQQKKKEASETSTSRPRKSEAQRIIEEAQIALAANVLLEDASDPDSLAKVASPHLFPISDRPISVPLPIRIPESVESELMPRPLSPGSNSTGPLSRDTSPAPSTRSTPATTESCKGDSSHSSIIPPSTWKGCQSFYCPATRPAGDHRRRCNSIMCQCLDCKVLVCDDCVTDLDKPCPCQGCRLPPGETDPLSGGTAAFYCPNCRHDRILTRKCRRQPACLARSRSMPVRKERHIRRMTPQEKFSHIADFLLDPNAFPDDFTLDSFFTGVDAELQELQEISMTAVSVVRRVQNLRSQAPPGSPAAIALPNIIIEGIDDYDASSISS